VKRNYETINKYIEIRVNIFLYHLIPGIDKLITTVAGTLAGGIITRRLNLGLTGCVRMVMVCRGVVAALSCLNFFLGCPTGDIAGLTVIDGHGTVEPYADAASVLNGYLILVIIIFNILKNWRA